MKTVSIMQPYLFAYLGYYQLLNLSDTFVILDDVNYIKKGWVNRNRILGQQEPLLFTVPLKDASQNRHIKDTYLHESYTIWVNKFNTTLSRTYKKAPHYAKTKELINAVLGSCVPGDSISKLCLASLKAVIDYLKIKTQLVETSATYKNQQLKGQDRILDICKQEKTNRYVNLSGGQELYSPQTFEDAGIELKFHKILKCEYTQNLPQDFQAHLSLIDVLMFCSIEQIQELLQQYEVI